jgi:glycosyltransferase involved in cell wall biosynthesis
MRIALVSDVYPPLRSSGAVQLRDLSLEMVRQGHEVTVLVASPEQSEAWREDRLGDVRILRLRCPQTKDLGYARRALGEALMPFAMLRNLRSSPLANQRWDGIVWYSPTIFLGPVARRLKGESGCRGYLIVRDIFPEWAVDMGLMGNGFPYRFFRAVARFQYATADVIGVQTEGNLDYFRDWMARQGKRVEVLHNWLAEAPNRGCSISIGETALAGRRILVYAGNMGVAQGLTRLLDTAESLQSRTDLGFLFVGRGGEAQRLRQESLERRLDNVIFFDEIDPDEIPGLYAQCHIGLVALDPRHKTHNIPGKFLSYMQSGLPVLASVNPGNDLVHLIQRERVGRACTESSIESLRSSLAAVLSDLEHDPELPVRCRQLAAKKFSPDTAVRQIVEALRA